MTLTNPVPLLVLPNPLRQLLVTLTLPQQQFKILELLSNLETHLPKNQQTQQFSQMELLQPQRWSQKTLHNLQQTLVTFSLTLLLLKLLEMSLLQVMKYKKNLLNPSRTISRIMMSSQ